MRRVFAASLVAILLVCSIVSVDAAVEPFSNPVFHLTSLYLFESFYVQFSASTMLACPTISVSLCSIQKLVNGKWTHYQTLTPPSYVAVNAISYDETGNYTAYKPSNGTYRIKATFTAMGESVTGYSASRTY